MGRGKRKLKIYFLDKFAREKSILKELAERLDAINWGGAAVYEANIANETDGERGEEEEEGEGNWVTQVGFFIRGGKVGYH